MDRLAQQDRFRSCAPLRRGALLSACAILALAAQPAAAGPPLNIPNPPHQSSRADVLSGAGAALQPLARDRGRPDLGSRRSVDRQTMQPAPAAGEMKVDR